jgi:hypothetical protein
MNRICYYIPVDGFIEGHGYRVSIVTENEAGHSPSGAWPYTGKPGETAPWFWGNDYDKACEIAKKANERLGLTESDVLKIITSSMAKGLPPRRERGKRRARQDGDLDAVRDFIRTGKLRGER